MSSKEEVIREVQKRGGTREDGERMWYRRDNYRDVSSSELVRRDTNPSNWERIKDIFSGR